MYRRILVPVDGSRTAGLGLAEALRLAKAQGAVLRLVNVVNDLAAFAGPEVAIYSDQVLKGLQAHGRAVLAEAEQAARAAGVDAETRCIETAGEGAGDAIVAEARAWKADLIVIGTHGRRGLRRLVLGSDAETVVRTAPVPVLLVRATEGSPA